MSVPKRRRIEPTPDGCGEGTSMVTLIHRREDDIRRSYEDMYAAPSILCTPCHLSSRHKPACARVSAPA